MHSKQVTCSLSPSRSRSLSIKAAGLCNDLFIHTCTHPQKQYLPSVCLVSHKCQQLSARWYFLYVYFLPGWKQKVGLLDCTVYYVCVRLWPLGLNFSAHCDSFWCWEAIHVGVLYYLEFSVNSVTLYFLVCMSYPRIISIASCPFICAFCFYFSFSLL